MRIAWLCRAAPVGLVVLMSARARADTPTQSKADAHAATGTVADAAGALQLRARERGPGLPWHLSIVNRSDAPVTLVADPRLLWFEVRVPGRHRVQTCRLPGQLFPSYGERRANVVLHPGEGVGQSFDPRLYCFAERHQWRLVPGAIVTPYFGFPEKRARAVWRHGRRVEREPSAPFVAAPTTFRPGGDRYSVNHDPDQKQPGRVKQLKGQPFSLRSAFGDWANKSKDLRKPQQPLELVLSRGSDAYAERTATVVVKIKNRSKHGVHFFVRRELIHFTVLGPEGLSSCDPQPDTRAPDPESFSYLRPGQSMSLTSRLPELCPHGTFGEPGLYLVHARYDANVSGERFGIRAFVGQIASREPAAIRIHTAEEPFVWKLKMQRFDTAQAQPADSNDSGPTTGGSDE
jgi:hypothetical protein